VSADRDNLTLLAERAEARDLQGVRDLAAHVPLPADLVREVMESTEGIVEFLARWARAEVAHLDALALEPGEQVEWHNRYGENPGWKPGRYLGLYTHRGASPREHVVGTLDGGRIAVPAHDLRVAS
jgi:hypothetical protein